MPVALQLVVGARKARARRAGAEGREAVAGDLAGTVTYLLIIGEDHCADCILAQLLPFLAAVHPSDELDLGDPRTGPVPTLSGKSRSRRPPRKERTLCGLDPRCSSRMLGVTRPAPAVARQALPLPLGPVCAHGGREVAPSRIREGSRAPWPCGRRDLLSMPWPSSRPVICCAPARPLEIVERASGTS